MSILGCSILLFLSLFLECSMGFHKLNMLTLTLNSNLRDAERSGIQDRLTSIRRLPTPVDHYNRDENRYWSMVYFDNFKYFKANGPIILEIGGEDWNFGTFAYFTEQLARETGGALFTNQHRYYGASYKEFHSLNYLSSRQSLADIAYLLHYLKTQEHFKRSKVVVIGCSYAGNLAAWMRLLYPDLVDAAHASSAPLLVKADFSEYMKHVSDVLRIHCNPEDYQSIKRQFKRYDELLKSRAGLRQLRKEANICYTNNLLEPLDVNSVFYSLILPFMGVVQSSFQHNLKGHCKNMSYDLSNRQYLPNTCIGSFYDVANEYKQLTGHFKYWVYQTCNEFGYFRTLSSHDHIFTQNLPVEFYYALCRETFGPKFSKETIERRIEETNQFYGGLNSNFTRVVFVNGDLDPWSPLSVLEDISPEAPARVIHGVSHCNFLRPPFGNPKLVEVQEFAKKMIKKWIGVQ